VSLPSRDVAVQEYQYGGFKFACAVLCCTPPDHSRICMIIILYIMHYCTYVVKIDRCTFFFPSFKFLAFWFRKSSFFFFPPTARAVCRLEAAGGAWKGG